jgi:luciferase family oxidoreductase group 1
VTLFSVLDQAPTRAGTPAAQSIRDVVALARHVDALGYARFWIAEHHAMGGVASTAPEVLIGHAAAETDHLRIGSGGILLPNHRPIHVAEQFLTLEALHPGRIDLGIGRSEGATDDATVRAFMRPSDNDHGSGFDRQLDELLAFGGARSLTAEIRLPPSGPDRPACDSRPFFYWARPRAQRRRPPAWVSATGSRPTPTRTRSPGP